MSKWPLREVMSANRYQTERFKQKYRGLPVPMFLSSLPEILEAERSELLRTLRCNQKGMAVSYVQAIVQSSLTHYWLPICSDTSRIRSQARTGIVWERYSKPPATNLTARQVQRRISWHG